MRHLEKVNKAIGYIEAHLNEKLDLEAVANGVHYSKYYLHRSFTETVGLTIHEYIQRRKLTEAAKLLVFSDRSILDIALLAGYDSRQAFTDVFSAMYKQTPNECRKQKKFYPLQLRFQFEGSYPMLHANEKPQWRVTFAEDVDIPCWMKLVRLVIDGFPLLEEDVYMQELRQRIEMRQALILKDGETAVGIMLFSRNTGSIDFMGTHPLYRQMGVSEAFLQKVLIELADGKEISITTYRKGDKADTGQRREILGLGFAEAELLMEFGYPTQKFVLQQEELNG